MSRGPKTPAPQNEDAHIKGRKQLVPEGPKHRLHQKKRALQKLISCLEVNKTDFTKKCTAKQTCLRGPQHRLHTDESTHSKGKQNSCLGVHRDRLHHRRALYKTNLPQGPTPPASHMRAPTARVNRTNQPRGHQQRPHVRESIDNKGNQNACLGANKTDLTKRARAYANASSDTEGQKANYTKMHKIN